jgi:NitT/TauT family transport system substrate-binding protein
MRPGSDSLSRGGEAAMSTRQPRRMFLLRAAGAAGAGLAVSLLNACGGTAAPAQPAQTSQPAAPGPTRAAPGAATSVSKVTYAFATYAPFHYVAIVAQERPDLPRAFGIEFDPITTTNAPNAMNALVGGSVHVAAVTPDTAWPAQDKAPDVKQVLAVADGSPYVLVAQKDITRAADLRGKTLGSSAVRGGADTTALKVMLYENGVMDGEYTIVQSGSIADRTAALKAGSIQAVAQLEPQATLLRDAGFAEIDNANNYPSLKNAQSIVLAANKSWYEGQADVAQRFVRAWDAITRWVYDPANHDDLLAMSKKTMNVGDKPAENAYNLHVQARVLSQNVRISEKLLQQFLENLKKAGVENIPPDPMKYVDNSLVEKALGSA